MYTPVFETKWNGVPVVSKRALDTMAECYIQDFNSGAMENPMEIDIDRFVIKQLGMEQDFQYLSHNGVYLGMTVFNDTDKVPIYDPYTNKAEYISAQAGTMLIDNRLLDERQERRYRFTVGHEGAHRILHSRYFQRAVNVDQPLMVQCRIDMSMQSFNSYKWTDSTWMEWQANYLSSALLMPKSMVQKIAENKQPKNSAFLTAACICAVSKTFNVSLQSAGIRLKELGLLGEFSKSDIEFEMSFLPRLV